MRGRHDAAVLDGLVILWEPFAGSACVAMHALGCGRICNYMGSKARIAADILHAAGVADVESVHLTDAGPWGDAWASDPLLLAERVEWLIGCDSAPAELFQRLAAKPYPENRTERAAVFLVLQGLNFRGKPVAEHDGRWRVAGMDSTSAYGREGTCKFSEVKPQYTQIPARLRALPGEKISGGRFRASSVPLPADLSNWFVYLDPPYLGTTCNYAATTTLESVVHLAGECHRRGARVALSYSEPVKFGGRVWEYDLKQTSKASRMNVGGRTGTKARAEWVTVNRPPVQAEMW